MFPQDAESPIWIPDRLVRPFNKGQEKKAAEANKKKNETELKKLQLSPPRARATNKATPSTWGQIKKLTRSAKKAVISVEKTVTDENMCPVILAVLTTQAMLVTGEKYWAYVPNPVTLHPMGWGDNDVIEVTTNNNDLLGGIEGISEAHLISNVITYKEMSDATPVCVSMMGKLPPGGLSLSCRIFLTDAPDQSAYKKDKKSLM